VIIQAVLVFILSATVAVPWALWSKAVADLQPFKAAVSDMAILAFGGISILSYTGSPGLLPVVILGGGIGTYGTVWRQRRQHQRRLLVLDELTLEAEKLGLYSDPI
jgi:hypothetical protein